MAAQQARIVERLFRKGEEEPGGGNHGNARPMNRATRIKSKNPAPIQITAESLIRSANDREETNAVNPVQVRIGDTEELLDYRQKKRKEFEDRIRRSSAQPTAFMKYAQWEEGQLQLDRARSVWERALEADHRNITVWLKYTDMEMRHRNINRARNLWDRAVTILPRVNQLWLKYAFMEEMLGNIPGARNVFERWLGWHPGTEAWHAFIKMELRCRELERARALYQRMLKDYPDVESWMKYAKFEEKIAMDRNKARAVYEQAIAFLDENAHQEKLFLAFAQFEEKAKEPDRARVIYKYALDHIPRDQAPNLYSAFVAFEKQHGDREEIEDVIVAKSRFSYEEQVRENPRNYDVWFDYIKLEMANSAPDKTRDVFERAIAQRPPLDEKRAWRRYIYLWINYALFEELDCEDFARTREVYKACLRFIPHKSFSFTKIWVMFAHFELRQRDLTAARKIFGRAIGTAPTDKIFKSYIQLEADLGEVDRCRAIYEKWLDWNSAHCGAWVRFAEMETSLAEHERARAIFDLAIAQPLLDMPEVVWKAYIDFEIEQEEYERARNLYAQLLERTSHVKVLISAALFEAKIGELDRARTAFEKGHNLYKENAEHKEERVLLLEAWLEFEREHGDDDSKKRVSEMMPKRIKKKRAVVTDDGTDGGWEEYYDYIFPEEANNAGALRILEMARMWKKQRTES